jgi:hypothetical protein
MSNNTVKNKIPAHESVMLTCPVKRAATLCYPHMALGTHDFRNGRLNDRKIYAVKPTRIVFSNRQFEAANFYSLFITALLDDSSISLEFRIIGWFVNN